jgi:hypothetical protein
MPLAARGDAPSVLVSQPPSAAKPATPFDRAAIARLSCADIQGLSCEELVRIVRTAPPPTVLPPMLARLEFQNREILERLAFLARECCRNRPAIAAR